MCCTQHVIPTYLYPVEMLVDYSNSFHLYLLLLLDAIEAVLHSLEDIRGLVDGPNGDQEFLSEILENNQLRNLLGVSY